MTRKAMAVVDLGFGDAGKGTMVDYLVHKEGADLVVRFNGGAQAGHNVVTPDGRHHTFSQFGSAAFQPGVRTYLSKHMAVHPLGIFAENAHLTHVGVTDAFDRLLIDAECLVTTPYHQVTNRLRETQRGRERHGSCGIGHGETVGDSLDWPELAIRVGELTDKHTVRRKLSALRALKVAVFDDPGVIRDLVAVPEAKRDLEFLFDGNRLEDIVEAFADAGALLTLVRPERRNAVLDTQTVVFEGAQGVLLDEWYGFHPHTTWSTTHFENVLQILNEIGFEGELERIGVLRTLAVRHGAGPFVTEDAKLRTHVREKHNAKNLWQGGFRLGWFDAVAMRYALAVAGGVDSLALTHLDWVPALPEWRACTAYRLPAGIDTGTAPVVAPAGRISRLDVLPAPDLERQGELTRVVAACDPEYGHVSTADEGSVVASVEALLGAPVRYTSAGRTREEKGDRGLASSCSAAA